MMIPGERVASHTKLRAAILALFGKLVIGPLGQGREIPRRSPGASDLYAGVLSSPITTHSNPTDTPQLYGPRSRRGMIQIARRPIGAARERCESG